MVWAMRASVPAVVGANEAALDDGRADGVCRFWCCFDVYCCSEAQKLPVFSDKHGILREADSTKVTTKHGRKKAKLSANSPNNPPVHLFLVPVANPASAAKTGATACASVNAPVPVLGDEQQMERALLVGAPLLLMIQRKLAWGRYNGARLSEKKNPVPVYQRDFENWNRPPG